MIIPGFLPKARWWPLLERARTISDYVPAGIGRGDNYRGDVRVRSDRVHWLESEHPADVEWLALMEELRQAINRRLFLGLFEFEAHYACYPPGSCYKRHVDAFRGQGNRVLSVVFYLNPSWQPADGGELVLYTGEDPGGLWLMPHGGTLAVFLSEDFDHEVLPAVRTRYSIAGWFRVNATTGEILDPPS